MGEPDYYARLQKLDSVVNENKESGDEYLGTFTPPVHMPEVYLIIQVPRYLWPQTKITIQDFYTP